MIIEREAYPLFHYNGTNFRQSIQDPPSRLRKLIEFVENNHKNRGWITKHDFYWSIQPNRAFIRPPNVGDHDFLKRKLRKGWNQTFWTSVQRAGVIKRNVHKMKDIHGRWWYDKGDRWDWWLTTYLFFTKDDTVTRWVYDETDIPEGWTVQPTSITDDFGTLKSWAHRCDRLIDRGIPHTLRSSTRSRPRMMTVPSTTSTVATLMSRSLTVETDMVKTGKGPLTTLPKAVIL